MRVKLYIVTYNNPEHLAKHLDSLFEALSDSDGIKLEVNVINNHSNFKLDPLHQTRVRVYHNVLRPDFSTGHLSRNWNQALINGFRDLSNPDCEIVITAQDDTLWKRGGFRLIREYIEGRFKFMSFGWGDNVCVYTPAAVKRIGMWDERFCNIGYQELDYFLRAVKYLPESSSINDSGHHGRHINGLGDDFINNHICERPAVNEVKKIDHDSSKRFHHVSRAVFRYKWNYDGDSVTSFEDMIAGRITGEGKQYMTYPYFEKDIEGLENKYVVY